MSTTTPDIHHIVVRSVLMPLQGLNLLLPNAAVSEVVSFETPEHPLEGDDAWLLGTQVWRQQIIPLISLERMLGMTFDGKGKRLMVAVCNTLNGNKRRPYIGVVLSDIPHLIRAHHSMIDEVIEEGDPQQLALGKIKINGEVVIIPDLDELEKRVNAELS